MRTDSANTSPGACVHGPRYLSANAVVTCTDSPVRSATSRNMPAPVCGTTLRYCAPRKCLPVRNHGPSQASSFRAGQALSLRQASRHTERHKKSRLAFFVSLAVKDGELSERLIDNVESTHHWGRCWTTSAACRASLDPLAAAARLSDGDAFTRSAVAKCVTLIEDDAVDLRSRGDAHRE